MLTQAQIDQLHRDGFLVLKNFLAGPELAQLQAVSGGIVEEAMRGQGPDNRYHTHADGRQVYYRSDEMWKRHDIYHAVSANPKILTIVGQCIGHPFYPINDALVCKAPCGNVPIKWHQDPPCMDSDWEETFGIPNVDVDVYLDHSTVANGCVWAIPGHHLVGHVQLENFREEQFFRDFGAVPLEAAPGDVVLHCLSAPHGSAGNVTDTLRRTYYVHYMAYEVFAHDYQGRYDWIADKDPHLPARRELIQGMLDKRRKLGFGDLTGHPVRWTEQGYEYVPATATAPRTPPWHWRTLAGRISAEEKERMRRLETACAAKTA